MKAEEMAEEYANSVIGCGDGYYEWTDVFDGFLAGYNKAKEEMQAQEYSMSYENGIFKCKYKSGKEFESVDGKTWKKIVLPELPEESE